MMRLEKRWAICMRVPAKFVANFKHRLWAVLMGDGSLSFVRGPVTNVLLYHSEQDARLSAVAAAVQTVLAGDVEVVEVSAQLVRNGFLE